MGKVMNRLPQVLGNLKERDDVQTQKELARRLEMDEGKLSRLLRMQPSDLVSASLLNKLYQEFGLTPNDVLLFTGTDDA